jgi:hypothetical protein
MSRGRPGRRTAGEIVGDLAAADFFAHAAAGFDRRALVEQATAGNLVAEASGRFFFLDAETLYEEGPQAFMEAIAPFLRRGGVHFDLPAKFDLRLHDRRFSIVPDEEAPDLGRWKRAAWRLLRALDWGFERSGLVERSYYTHIDNDSVIAFLTPRMAELWKELGDAVGGPIELHRAPDAALLED